VPRTGLRIGDLAKRAGMARSAIRYYEQMGLLAADARTASGYRLYADAAVDRLRFIREAKSLGIKLSEIRSIIVSPRTGREEEHAFFTKFLRSKIDKTQSEIASLQRVARRLRVVETRLSAEPPPDCCHLGDCACWLPA
jgi:DNA-binding transcriptional MerR regulator